MKTLICAILAVAFAPGVAFAQQSDAPVTARAQVRAELIQLENAGYDPAAANDVTYPADLQAAEARVGAQTISGYGGMIRGSSRSGAPAIVRPRFADSVESLYFGS